MLFAALLFLPTSFVLANPGNGDEGQFTHGTQNQCRLIEVQGDDIPLHIKKNATLNKDAILLEGLHEGGRLNITYRDDTGKDVARLAAHSHRDSSSDQTHWQVYTAKADGSYVSRFDIDGEVDHGKVSVTGATLEAVQRSTTETNLRVKQDGNYVVELLRPHSSPNGANYFMRNLPLTSPVIKITQANTDVGSPALLISNKKGVGIDLTSVTEGQVFKVNHDGTIGVLDPDGRFPIKVGSETRYVYYYK